ncbi:hypothetical protein F5B20DRAFT_590105 [Whalleya microplaca]|nr:hypothetical protein F5B20DRAFT_590105 [Whalleya microplaca]
MNTPNSTSNNCADCPACRTATTYRTQRALLAPSHTSAAFQGKTSQIAAQHARFWSHPEAHADVGAYALGSSGPVEHVYGAPEPAAKWLKASTPFTSWKGPVLAESAGALIVGNRSSFDAGQYLEAPERAGMSIVHVLGIPRAGLFNGVSLNANSVAIVDEMVALFKASWASRPFREAVMAHQRRAIMGRFEETRGGSGWDAYGLALKHYMELESMVLDGLTADDFAFGLHLWPDHSVGHLHLHIIAMPYACRKYSTAHHDAKTKDAFEVRDFIKSLPSN